MELPLIKSGHDAHMAESRNLANIVVLPPAKQKKYVNMEKEGVVVFNAYKDVSTDVSKNFAKIVDLSRRNVFTRKSRGIAKTVGLYRYQNESTKIANTTYQETHAKSAVGWVYVLTKNVVVSAENVVEKAFAIAMVVK